MTYHVRGIVVATRAHGHTYHAADGTPGHHAKNGIYAVLTIRDRNGDEWECPWGADPDVPALGAEMVLGCKVVG